MIFGISDEDFFDNNKIKVIDGIAGAGKSSMIDKFFEDNAKIYGRYTSTNALKRDAQKRYPGTICETVASGLFKTDGENMIFYKEPREIEFEHIVIDEILQTSRKVVDYCRENCGLKNIIITTDTKQLLAPECGESLVEDFLSLKNEPNVIWVTLTESKRPVNAHTQDMYAYAYEHADDDRNLYGWVKNRVNTAKYEDIKITKDDIVLTHTKDIEAFIYRQINPREAGFELIPKGTIARKGVKDLEKVPVIPQKIAEKRDVKAYLQAKSICTPTRYQGSEAQPGQHLYYVVEKTSRVSAREIYTVLTRCKDIDDLTIVEITLPGEGDLRKFCGKPVKKHGYLSIDREMPELDRALKTGYADANLIKSVVRNNPNDAISYDRDVIYYKGEMLTTKENLKTLSKAKEKRKYTPSSLMKKDEKMAYQYVAEIYRTLESHGIDVIQYPYIIRPERPEEEYKYELDLYSAYPTILKYEKMPIDGMVSYTKGQNGYLDFYICTKENPIVGTERIFTGEFPELVPYGDYLFSIPCERGLKSGVFLWDQAHRSIESKKNLKDFHWGYYQKKYLTPVLGINGKVEYYELNENFIYEILMVAIVTILTKISYHMLQCVPGYPVVDAVKFPQNENVEKLKMMMSKNFPDYDFRIKNLKAIQGRDREGNVLEHYSWDDICSGRVRFREIEKVLFQTYPDLPTEAQRRRAQKTETMRQLRAKQKEV